MSPYLLYPNYLIRGIHLGEVQHVAREDSHVRNNFQESLHSRYQDFLWREI
jgi:hypothetical protein